MTLWFVFALMTAAAIFAVLWPLGRGGRPQNEGSEAAVYKDQLAEIDRDVAAGLIGSSEAEAARVEISRRLLAAADSQRDPPVASNTSLRRSGGDPGPGWDCRSWRWRSTFRWARRGSAIFRWRNAPARPTSRSRSTIWWRRSKQHLEKNPTDGRGWNVLAPVLARLGRYDDAVRAYRNSITYNGDSAERRADLGEALAAAAGGVVTSEAKAEFERAIALERRRGQGELLPWPCRRAGRPRHRGRLDLACDAGKGAGGCAVASAGSGRIGAGRRFHRCRRCRMMRWRPQKT